MSTHGSLQLSTGRARRTWSADGKLSGVLAPSVGLLAGIAVEVTMRSTAAPSIAAAVDGPTEEHRAA